MMIRILACLFCATLLAHAAPETRKIDGVTYHLLKAKPEEIRVVWKDGNGRQIKTFPEAAAFLRTQGLEPLSIMNGGIYEPGGIPSGLLVQDGKELCPVNRRDGEGNFFLKPNGIFSISGGKAAVTETASYTQPAGAVDQAVQSGPLLLAKGKVHPAFREGSPNGLHRNGVGITRDGAVLLIMTDHRSPEFPNLHRFATLFRDLGCDDALFLDGDISQFRHGADVDRPSGDFGCFIAVVKPSAAK